MHGFLYNIPDFHTIQIPVRHITLVGFFLGLNIKSVHYIGNIKTFQDFQRYFES